MSRSSIVSQSKQAERDVATLMDGYRFKAGEWHWGGDVDIAEQEKGPWAWVGQVKQRKDVAGYIREGMKQLDEARVDDADRLLFIKTKPGSGRSAEIYVLMRLEQFMRINNDFEDRIMELLEER